VFHHHVHTSPIIRTLVLAALTLVLAVFGWWLARDIRQSAKPERPPDSGASPEPKLVDTPNQAPKRAGRRPGTSRDDIIDAFFGLPRERLVRIGSDEAYRRFLAGLDGRNLRLLGQIDGLRTARIGYDDLGDLEDLLGDDDESFSNYYVSIPQLPDVDAQPGAAGFGTTLLDWLGITGDRSALGSGVRIAVLDTGVSDHGTFSTKIREIDLVTREEPVPLNGHGTAVTSLITGDSGASQGIAPGAEVVSIRIGDENGESNSFLLAQGIVQAVDEGVQLINISMGSYGDSAIVRDAVGYAAENGTLIIASAGNEGLEGSAFPAAYEGVVSVGAVDANGDHLLFSNQGVDLAAPGYSVAAAWPGEQSDQFVYFTGTSASAPVVTAAIAATMTSEGLGAAAAYELVVANLNEAGSAGTDPFFGDGIIDVGRTFNSDVPGIFDAATASHVFAPATVADPSSRLEVTVENRGTELLTNSQLTINVNGDNYTQTVPSLRPGEHKTVTIPVNVNTATEELVVRSSISLTNGRSDQKPSNDGLSTQVSLLPPTDPEP
jgi:thermitase